MKKRRLIFIVIVAIIWLTIMRFPSTEPFGWMFFGCGVIIPSLVLFVIRLNFDFSSKQEVIGKLIEIREHYIDYGKTYSLIYRYYFNNQEKTFAGPVSSFRYKRTKLIGQEDLLLILIKKPSRVRMKKYLGLEYLCILIVFVISLLFFYHGLQKVI